MYFVTYSIFKNVKITTYSIFLHKIHNRENQMAYGKRCGEKDGQEVFPVGGIVLCQIYCIAPDRSDELGALPKFRASLIHHQLVDELQFSHYKRFNFVLVSRFRAWSPYSQ